MDRINKYNLNKGIRLENCETLVPWNTELGDLKKFGNPEIKKQQGREIVVWKNEKIMNGLTVNLNVIYEAGLFGTKKKLKNVNAYISETDFDRLRGELDSELGKKGRFKQLNEMEFEYVWKVNNCKLILSRVCRFGTYWKIEIRHSFSLAGMFRTNIYTKMKNILQKHLSSQNTNLLFNFSGLQSAPALVLR